MAFFRKADAKVRQISEPTKLFEEKFSESFYQHRFTTFSLLQYVNLSPFSLESGCKITALQHIHQIFVPSFFRLFCKSLILKELFGKRFSRREKGGEGYTLLFSRARMRMYIHINFAHQPFTLFTGYFLAQAAWLFISFARTKETKQRKFAGCTFLPTPALFYAKQKELASLKQLFVFNAPKSTSASRQKSEAGPLSFLRNIASLVFSGM